ncbi:MAG TPA: hypothetical protein PLI09_18565 [Candidatus Hydrogenedentes bacterium]|nr:hypothetical protein [Candidatus Hydrogenedentota bacterium]
MIERQEFRLAGKYRRCAYYIFAAALLAPPLVWWISNKDSVSQDLTALCVVWSFLLFISVCFLLWLFRWRLTVDSRGISRRRFLGWRHWPWECFQNGNARQRRLPSTFVFVWDCQSLKPLSFLYLEDKDCEYLLNFCRSLMPPITPLDTDDEIAFTVPVRPSFGTRVRCCSGGITVRLWRTAWTFSWSDVEQLTIKRWSHFHDDFYHLSLQLPDRQVVLRCDVRDGSKLWFGPKPEVITALFLKYVPPSRVMICAEQGITLSRKELGERRADIEKMLLSLRKARIIATLGYFAYICYFLVWPLIKMLPLKTSWDYCINFIIVLYLLGIGILIYAPFFSVSRRLRKKLDEIASQETDMPPQTNKDNKHPIK